MARQEINDESIRHIEPMLMAFALRAVRSPDVARDLVQETYLAAIEAHGRFEGRSTLRTWMVGILSRKIVDHFRRGRRELVVDVPPESELPSKFAPMPPTAPDRALDDRAAMRVIDRSLGDLSELERMAVLLCDVEQLARSDACSALDVKPTHLRVLLHRGRHKLRKALEDAAMRPGR